jgi:hypothetical protein
LNSFDLTAVWQDNLPVTVTGLLSGVVEDSATLIPLAAAPTLETLNWSNINEVDILSATSGTQHAGYSGNGTQVAIDNLTITQVVPAPVIGRGLPVILAVGGVLFGAKLLERSKKHRSPGTAPPPAAA